MPNKFEVELAEGVAKKVAENPAVRAAAKAAGQFLEECFPAAAAKVERAANSEIVRDILHLGPSPEKTASGALTRAAKPPSSAFELPGELGSARPNETYDNLHAAMSEPRSAMITGATRGRASAETSRTTPLTLPGEFGSQPERNDTYEDLYAAMNEPRRKVLKVTSRTSKSTPLDLPGSPGHVNPDSILP